MTDKEFVSAIQAMEGLPADMVDHVVSMASDLTEDQRKTAVDELSAANRDLIGSMSEMGALYQEGDEYMKQVDKEILPLRKLTEEAEKTAGVESAASQLDNAA